MAIIALTHNNKNQYRKYPFKQGSNLKTTQGLILPDTTITNCSITSIYGMHRIYVKQFFYKDNVIRIAIATISNDVVLGVFSGNVTEDFATLQLTPFIRFVSGSITLGTLAALQSVTATMNFKNDNAELEESTIFCYTPPHVTSIGDIKKNRIRGSVDFRNLVNLTKTNTQTSILFNVEDTTGIENRYDKSSYLGNCSTPTIKKINGVTPSAAVYGTSDENDNNIYLVGVKPIVFYGAPEQDAQTYMPGNLKVSAENVTLDSLCADKYKLIPPTDLSGVTATEGKDEYYTKTSLLKDTQSTLYPNSIPQRIASNTYSTRLPEYFYWPQFVKPEHYDLWSLEAPSAPTVTSILPSSNGAVVHYVPPKNSGRLEIVNYHYSLDNGSTWSSWTSKTSPIIVSEILTPSTDYYFVLRANNSFLTSGQGQLSATVKFTTLQ